MLADSIWHSLFQVPQLPIFMSLLIPVVAIIGFYLYKTQKVRSENELKRKMVERGMSVEEIERVIAASTKRDEDE
ncbi:MAG: hypothetical protein KAY37_05925 [Phycisphaerae bacterium]|nr:hypothetical protein [Phycisphaerae bacterium]